MAIRAEALRVWNMPKCLCYIETMPALRRQINEHLAVLKDDDELSKAPHALRRVIMKCDESWKPPSWQWQYIYREWVFKNIVFDVLMIWEASIISQVRQWVPEQLSSIEKLISVSWRAATIEENIVIWGEVGSRSQFHAWQKDKD